jgi:predicted DNA-binding ribbon-helix-helix protein
MTLPKADLDSPWKDVLRTYFPQAIAFFFPQTAALIDWGKPYTFLDKEFQTVSKDAEVGRRYADQLVQVSLKQGEPLWLFIHLEVQSQAEPGFEARMFTYCLRIFDQFGQMPTSLAILCDESQTWRPQSYTIKYPDSSIDFRFGIVKLIDFRSRWEELEHISNPFAIVVMAHLKTMETRPDAQQRKTWKLALIRGLYDRGLDGQDILNLYKFIDWVMLLPKGLENTFWQELKAFEQERKVTYVTTGERIGFEKGAQEGRQEGELTLVLRLLSRRIGLISTENEAQVRALSLTQLEALGEALLDFSQPSDLRDWLGFQ